MRRETIEGIIVLAVLFLAVWLLIRNRSSQGTEASPSVDDVCQQVSIKVSAQYLYTLSGWHYYRIVYQNCTSSLEVREIKGVIVLENGCLLWQAKKSLLGFKAANEETYEYPSRLGKIKDIFVVSYRSF